MWPNHLLQLLMLLSVSVCLQAVRDARAPGVYVANRTVSCCEGLIIPIDKDCLNRLFIEDTVLAQVKGTKAKVLKPFHFLQDENVMQVLDCVGFTHQINCDVVGKQEREDNIHFLVTPCHEDGGPNAAAAIQGSYWCLLLTVALLMVKSH